MLSFCSSSRIPIRNEITASVSLRAFSFCRILIERKPAFSMTPCSYYGHWHQGRRLQIYISHHCMLLFAPPATPEKLSWDQSVMLQTQALILHRGSTSHGSGWDKANASLLNGVDKAELLFLSCEHLPGTAPAEEWGQSCPCPATGAALPHTAETLTNSSNSPSCRQRRQWLPLVGFLLSLSGFCLQQLPVLPIY